MYLLPSGSRLAIEKMVLDLHIKPEGPKEHSCSVSNVGRKKPIAGQPGGVETEIPLEIQEQLENREDVDKSPIKCSLLAWRLLKCYFRRQEKSGFVYRPGKDWVAALLIPAVGDKMV